MLFDVRFGLRIPSFKKRLAARTSWKRIVRHNMGFKAPRGMGMFTSPKKALYNKVYQKTSFGVEDVFKGAKGRKKNSAPVEMNNSQSAASAFFTLTLGSFIFFMLAGYGFFAWLIVWLIGIFLWKQFPSQKKKTDAKE